MCRRKKWTTLFVIGLAALTLCCFTPGNAAALEFLSFGTGNPAGTYYFIGAGFASLIN